jgi:hypothetical protein
MTTNSQGKLVPQKVGLKEVTREGFEYELTLNLELDTKHNASCSKDRTGLFAGKPEFVPTEETGKALLEWCESGIDEVPVEDMLKGCKTLDELADMYGRLSASEKVRLQTLKDELKTTLTPKEKSK